MANPVIIAGGIVALIAVGVSYYIVMPMMFNTKAVFTSRVTDPEALARAELVYDIVGIFPLIFLGAIFLNMYTKGTRQHSSDVFGG